MSSSTTSTERPSDHIDPVLPPAVEAGTRWHKLSFASGLLLMLSFFLPFMSLRSGASPAELWMVGLSQWNNPFVSGLDQFHGFCAHVAAYAFGAIVSATALAGLFRRTALARACSFALAGLLTCIAVGLFAAVPSDRWMAAAQGSWLSIAATFVAAVGTLAYVVFATRLGREALLCYEFAGALASVIWFGFCALQPETGLGVYLSLTASAMLLIGVVGQAGLVVHRNWGQTELLLLTCLFSGRKPAQQVAGV